MRVCTRFDGPCVMNTATSCSFGSIVKLVPQAPAHMASPVEPGATAKTVLQSHGEAEPEAVARPRRCRRRAAGADRVVREHVLDGLLREDAFSVELAAVRDHLGEAVIVGNGRDEPGAALEVLLARRVFGDAVGLHHRLLLRVAVERLGEARDLVLRHEPRHCSADPSERPSGLQPQHGRSGGGRQRTDRRERFIPPRLHDEGRDLRGDHDPVPA